MGLARGPHTTFHTRGPHTNVIVRCVMGPDPSGQSHSLVKSVDGPFRAMRYATKHSCLGAIKEAFLCNQVARSDQAHVEPTKHMCNHSTYVQPSTCATNHLMYSPAFMCQPSRVQRTTHAHSKPIRVQRTTHAHRFIWALPCSRILAP